MKEISVTKIAHRLGLHPSRVHYKIKTMGIKPSRTGENRSVFLSESDAKNIMENIRAGYETESFVKQVKSGSARFLAVRLI